MGRWMGSAASDAGFFGNRRGLCASLSFARRLVGWQSEGLEAGRCSGSASVAVVEATDLGLGHDPPPCSKTIRTARSRTSKENVLLRAMTPSSQ